MLHVSGNARGFIYRGLWLVVIGLVVTACAPTNVEVVSIGRLRPKTFPSKPLIEANSEGTGDGQSAHRKLSKVTMGGNFLKTQAQSTHFKLRGGLLSGL
jgi:hypothetical protein